MSAVGHAANSRSEDVGQRSRRDSCDYGSGSSERKANDTSLCPLEGRAENAGWFCSILKIRLSSGSSLIYFHICEF